MIQLGSDLVGGLGPDEGRGIIVVLVDVAVDGRLQLDDRAEDAAPEPPPGQGGEEALDGVQPRGRGRGEVEGPARVPRQPGHDLGMRVGAVVVHDRVDELARGDRRLDGVEEAEELLVAVPLHAPYSIDEDWYEGQNPGQTSGSTAGRP